MPRFVVLEHAGHPEDSGGRHFDLLLENHSACRTWKMFTLPECGKGAVAAKELPPHRLAWLDIMESPVSGNRGRARRIDAGIFQLTSSDTRDLSDADKLVLEMDGTMLRGFLRFESFEEGWALRLE
ncbi:MAG: hypothetical protein ABGW78_12905 [Pirellulales bacterium]